MANTHAQAHAHAHSVATPEPMALLYYAAKRVDFFISMIFYAAPKWKWMSTNE